MDVICIVAIYLLQNWCCHQKTSPVTVANVMAVLNSKSPAKHYDGYASCPLVTGYGSLILAEFDYDKQPMESFPFDQGLCIESIWLTENVLAWYAEGERVLKIINKPPRPKGTWYCTLLAKLES